MLTRKLLAASLLLVLIGAFILPALAQETVKGKVESLDKEARKITIGGTEYTLSDEAAQADVKDTILFAMANPIPDIMPGEAPKNVQVIATGRWGYPNQINEVLWFPGFFKGILDCNAREINHEMLFAAGRAIASVVTDEELRVDYIIPSVFNPRVSEKVSIQAGVARLEHNYLQFYKV